MNLSCNNKQHLNAALFLWLIIQTNPPLLPPCIFMASFGNGLRMCFCVFMFPFSNLRTLLKTYVCVSLEKSGETIKQMCERSSHCRTTQCFTAPYSPLLPLLSQWSIVFSTINCCCCLIVLALSGLFFFTCVYTQSHKSDSFSQTITHMHTQTLPPFYSFCIFLWSALGQISSCRSPIP